MTPFAAGFSPRLEFGHLEHSLGEGIPLLGQEGWLRHQEE
jgi:hypothetical protein